MHTSNLLHSWLTESGRPLLKDLPVCTEGPNTAAKSTDDNVEEISANKFQVYGQRMTIHKANDKDEKSSGGTVKLSLSLI